MPEGEADIFTLFTTYTLAHGQREHTIYLHQGEVPKNTQMPQLVSLRYEVKWLDSNSRVLNITPLKLPSDYYSCHSLIYCSLKTVFSDVVFKSSDMHAVTGIIIIRKISLRVLYSSNILIYYNLLYCFIY